MFEEGQEKALEKEERSIKKIKTGLEGYLDLLTYENLSHFRRIKRAIGYTVEEFEEYLPADFREMCYNALLIGPE